MGRYEIRSLLGQGGMGEVYLAHDTILRRDVAIKVLPRHLAHSADHLRRIEVEAYAASSLNHPNILTVYEIGTENSTAFIAAEFIDGVSLRQRMGLGALELRDILDIGAQVASALAVAHASGITHRDIKPENIMIRKDGVVKLLDFGLAKVAERSPDAADPETRTMPFMDTAPGVVLGTVHYMSPEQARGLHTDSRTDVWSLGVVLYELLARRLTFEGRTASDVIAAILKTDPPPLTKYPVDIPPELDRIVTKALQKDADERYQAIRDLELDLKALKRRLEFDAERSRQSLEPVGTNEGPARTDLRPKVAVETPAGRSYARLRAPTVSLAGVAIVALAYGVYAGYFRPFAGRNVDSVAVLPFGNENGNPDTEYLSDGITVALINNLSGLTGVKVIARTSAFTYKGKEVDPQDVARALGVKAIVTGRVTQRGDNLSITVELIDVADRTLLWGQQYQRGAADLLQVQADISGEIADKLRQRLSSDERQRLTKRETTDPKAYDLVLRGRFYFEKGGTQNRKIAIEHYQRALAIDPNYALAYVSLAEAYHYLIYLSVLSPSEFMPKVDAAVRKALELDSSLAEAHSALGKLKRSAWDWAAAERAFRRAIDLNPNLADAHDGAASLLTVVGRHEEAVAESHRATELDPLSMALATRVGLTLLFARRHDEAIRELEQSLMMDGQSSVPYLFLGYNYAAKRMYPEAVKAYDKAIALGDDSSSAQIYLAAAYAGAGDRARALSMLKRLETSTSYVSPGELAVLYAALRQKEQAFQSLEKGFRQRDVQLVFIGCDPAFDSLRDDPRLAELMARMGLPVTAIPTAGPA
jgi:eukaryotic-like serine/threonine-protein kinase